MSDWRRAARCRDEDPELFFPIGYDTSPALLQIAEAKAVCAQCQVRRECGDYADKAERDHGIYGGHTPQERETRRRRQAREMERRKARQRALDDAITGWS